MKKLLFLILIVISFLPFRGRGQNESAAKAIHSLHKLAENYKHTQFLAYDVLYRYAAEAKPGEYLDSLRGQFKIQGNRYWSVLDNRVSVFDAQLLLMVFNEDSLIYLAKPRTDTPGSQSPANPVAMLDSFLLQAGNSAYTYTTTAGEELVSMSFAPKALYKKVTWHIDRKTGYLNKMVSVMQSGQLYDPSVRSLVEDAATSWVIVETLFTNYRQQPFDQTVFDLRKYIKKEGQEYVTVAPYEKYKVFLGSSGL